MDAVILLLLQAAAATPAPERIDLLVAAPPGCEDAAGEDIVVCGGSGADRYRLPRLSPRPQATLVPKAEVGLFGGAAAGTVETEAAQMPNGAQSNRLMARIRLPL